MVHVYHLYNWYAVLIITFWIPFGIDMPEDCFYTCMAYGYQVVRTIFGTYDVYEHHCLKLCHIAIARIQATMVRPKYEYCNTSTVVLPYVHVY